MEELISILKQVKPGVDFEKETALWDDGILDSLDVITIISEISDAYDITVSSERIISQNFNSAKAMKAMIDDIIEND